MLRLDVIPLVDVPQMSKSGVAGPYSVRIHCVLHSGQLSEHEELEVRVNDVLQTGVREGDQSVFTWQVFRASDEIRIVLLNEGIRINYWQGCWNERDAILHAGTLPVQVFFNGKPQPLLDATIIPVSSSLAETSNGNTSTESLVLRRDQQDEHAEEGSELPRREERTVFVQDVLVIAASGHVPDASQAMEVILDEEQQEEEESESSDVEEEDEENQWEEEEREPGADGMEGDEALHVGDVETGEAVVPGTEAYDLVGGVAQQRPAGPSSIMGGRLVAFHASIQATQERLQVLKDLVATMPSKTLIVDVRPTSRQKKRQQEHDSLSKPFLCSVFGAKYWDRAWAIQIAPQMVPLNGKGGRATWRYAVKNPENHPDGIPSLAKKLEEGYSIVVMDSSARYGESRRRAVIEELQQRVPNLDVGPLE